LFFFEKKNQKTFTHGGTHPGSRIDRIAGRICKSFSLLFFEKEDLPSSRLAFVHPGDVRCGA
jgi:hypothetical protein